MSKEIKIQTEYAVLKHSGFPVNRWEQISYGEVDKLYDLTGPNGFHGFSCDRWAPHFRKKIKPLSEPNKSVTLEGENYD